MPDAALPELAALERLLPSAAELGTVDVLAHVEAAGRRHPIYALRFGNPAPTTPRLIVVGGVHGLERIGTAVALAFLTSFLAQLRWDRLLAECLARCRVVFVPLLNPIGMALRRRANGNGVDLMRNAPTQLTAATAPPTLLVGGQGASRWLPWFRGRAGAPMELEATALCELVEAEVSAAPFALALDLHSGFGLLDRLWFPYARTMHPLPHLAEVRALAELVDAALPNHVYRMEPTARAYRIGGDLWDHLYDQRRSGDRDAVFLPLTLEMGSWQWLRKNPRQLLSRLGAFNPIAPHRVRRTLRRHLPLFELLLRAVASADAWAFPDPDRREQLERAAIAAWFPELGA